MLEQDGLTALHKAIIGKKEPVISHLLRKGANPHVKDRVRIGISETENHLSFLLYLSTE